MGMADAPLTLHSDGFWISPYVFSCFVALREKKVSFEVKEVKLHEAEQRSAEYARGSWTGRVPSLVHGDFWLSESSAIVEYVEEAFPAPAHARLLPEERTARARARQLLAWLRSDDTAPVRVERSTETMFYERPRPALSPKAAAAAAKGVELGERFLGSGRDHLFGAWSIADADLAFFLRRLWHDDVLTKPLRAHIDRQWARPSVAEFVGHTRVPFVPYAY